MKKGKLAEMIAEKLNAGENSKSLVDALVRMSTEGIRVLATVVGVEVPVETNAAEN